MVKEVIVSDSEYFYGNHKAKYKSTVGSKTEEGWTVKITYNSDGSVDEKNTYHDSYIREVLHPESSAKSDAKSSKKGGKDAAKADEQKKSEENEKDDDDDSNEVAEKVFKIIGRILLWPFKAIWWIIKQILKLAWAIVKFVLSIIGLGFIVGLLSGGDSDA